MDQYDCQVTDATKKSAPVFGAFDSSGTAVGLWVNGNGNMEPRLGGWGGGFAKADESRHVVTIDAATLTATYADAGGAVSATKTTANKFAWNGDASEPLWLFASYKDKAVCKGHCRIYSFKIYEGGALVHDWRPATKGGDVGFYDTEGDGGFIWNGWQPHAALASGGTLLEIEDDAYVSTEGNNCTEGGLFYDTEVFPTETMKVEIDYALCGVYDGSSSNKKDWFLLSGGQNANGHRFNLYYNHGGLGYSTSGANWEYVAQSMFPNPKGEKDVRRILTLDCAAASLVAETGGIVNTNIEVKISGAANYADYTIKIGGRLLADTAFTPMKIYGVRIWDGGAKKRDFRPCLKGGMAGLKDAVTGHFIPASRMVSSTQYELADGACGGAVEAESDDAFVLGGTSANQWLDVKYKPDGATRMELDFAQLDIKAANRYLVGVNGGASAVGTGNLAYSLFAFNKSDAKYRFGEYAYNCQDDKGNYAHTYFPQGLSRRTLVLDGANSKVGWRSADVSEEFEFSTTHAASTSVTVPLFNAYNGKAGSWMGDPLPMKVYGLRFYENGSETPSRDFRPYVRNGAVGLKDAVTGEFVAMDGATASAVPLSCGGAIESEGGAFDAYIESDGTQTIDTGYAVKHGTRVEADFALRAFANNARLFSAEDDDTSMYTTVFVQSANPMSLRTSCGDAWKNMVVTNLADFGRHTVSVDLTGGNAAYALSAAGSVAAGGKSAAAATKTAQIPLYLFARNFRNTSKGTGAVDNFASVRLYAFRVYEDGELVHEFLPYKKGDAVGLCDAKTGEVKLDAKGGNAFGYGGKGVDGAERWIAEPKGGTITKGTNGDGTRKLKAIVPGAVSYRWTVNGVEAEGGEDGEFTASWRRRGTTDVYAVYPIYSVFGETVEGEPRTAEIASAPAGTVIIIR